MAIDRDDDKRWDDEEPEAPRLDPRDLEAARKKVRWPGRLVLVFGLLVILANIATLGLAVAAPTFVGDAYVDAMKPILKKQPDTPQRKDALEQLEQARAGMRMDTPLSVGMGVLHILVGLVTMIGGAKMIALKSYGLALTAAILSLYPLAGCFCCPFPFGLWAVIVLMNSDVKAAFKAMKTQG
jgi:hypothetical protein